jgi:hypothetical protein
MQIHPLVPMRKAAALLGVEKDQLKAKLVSGEIKGEQRRVGSKDKWFVYSGEVSNRIDTERLPELMKRTDGQLALEVETVAELDPASLNDLDAFFDESAESKAPEDVHVTGIDIKSEALAHAENMGAVSLDAEVKSGLPAPADFNQIFESLTVVFAQRLSDEYQHRLTAEQKVKIAEVRVKTAEQKARAFEENIKRLEKQRDEAQYLVDERNSAIAEMEAQVRELERQVTAKKPSFWQKLFSGS